MRLKPQDVILGRYTVDNLIGRGGMGDVVRAHHRTLGVPVAIKVVGAGASEADASIEREALLLARVRHTNVVSVLDVGRTESGHHCLVMEWLDGEDLRVRLKRQQFLPWYVAVPLAAQIAAGLSSVHQAGMLHRDLKPANVMLLPGPPEQVKLIDFGLASPTRNALVTADQQTAPNFVGTPDYASPEQITGQPLDVRSDLYALGVVLFQMLTGHLPFGSDMVRSMRRRLFETAPRVFAPEGGVTVPDGVVAYVADLLATLPDERPASAAEVARRLREMEATGPVQLVWREPARTSSLIEPASAAGAQTPQGIVPVQLLHQARKTNTVLALAHLGDAPPALKPPSPMADTKRIQLASPPASHTSGLAPSNKVHLALALACGIGPLPDNDWLSSHCGHAILHVFHLRAMQVVVFEDFEPTRSNQAARQLLAALRLRYGTTAVWRTRFVAAGALHTPPGRGAAEGLPDALQPLVLEMRRLGFRVSDAQQPPAA